MSDDPKRPWYTQLPAKLAAVVVFLVAITTLIGNVVELLDKRRDDAAKTAAVSPAVAAPGTARAQRSAQPAPPQSDNLKVQLDRIAVDNDGSVRTTDWRFTVEADGEPLFVVQEDGMDDTAGRNVVRPTDAATVMRLPEGRRATLTVKGWRGSRLRLPGTEPDVTGEGVLDSTGALPPIRVAAAESAAGAFVFYFSATRE